MAKILVVNMDDQAAERICSVSDDVELINVGSEEEFEEKLPEAEIVISELQPQHFAKARKARWVAYHSAGIDHLVSPEILECDKIITCAKGFVGMHLAKRRVMSANLLDVHCAPNDRPHGPVF
jgi:phosphoglycerate dehydrogenase-like enzyme